MGTANLCDQHELKEGAPCIIEVDEVNSPTGVWWGEVIEAVDQGTYLSVQAVIKGRFKLNRDWEPVVGGENGGRQPGMNYQVYPATKTVQSIFWKLQLEKNEVALWKGRMEHWRETHLDTMTHLVREGVVRPEDKEA